jgi:hypothetical protein
MTGRRGSQARGGPTTLLGTAPKAGDRPANRS